MSMAMKNFNLALCSLNIGGASLDDRFHSAAHVELSRHHGPNRLDRGDEILEDSVHRVLLENPQIPVAVDIILQGLQFHTLFSRQVSDPDDSEIRQAGSGTDRGELWDFDGDFVPEELVRPAFQRGQSRPDACLGVTLGVLRAGHLLYCTTRDYVVTVIRIAPVSMRLVPATL